MAHLVWEWHEFWFLTIAFVAIEQTFGSFSPSFASLVENLFEWVFREGPGLILGNSGESPNFPIFTIINRAKPTLAPIGYNSFH